jgi:glycosyltransferase involved in cell wall biosynthesis
MTSEHSDRGRPGAGIQTADGIAVALLTGGGDKPYAYGLATELVAKGIALDLIGSDELDCPEFHCQPQVKFLNLRGNARPDASFASKVIRILLYYLRLIRYSATAKPGIFHILWNNKFQFFDRTILMLYYRTLGKKIVLTLHNVNADKRDSKDTVLNRFTLRIQYRLADHIFVHTEKMKLELIEEFGARNVPITVIPFGINNAVPNTDLSPDEAKQRLGIRKSEKTILFFGNIAPYKGLEYLVSAFQQLRPSTDYRLIIAGSPKDCSQYWAGICETIAADVQRGRVLLRAEFIPDNDTEIYFKAADVLVLPYRHIYQSGVLFLGYSFGLPVLAADVGSLKDEIAEGKSGFVFKPEDPRDLARVIERYFSSEIYANLNSRRQEIRNYGKARHSWDLVGRMTMGVYAGLLRIPFVEAVHTDEIPSRSFDVNTIDQVFVAKSRQSAVDPLLPLSEHQESQRWPLNTNQS